MFLYLIHNNLCELGAYATVIATAMAQLRNAYLSTIVNKNDPYHAIRILSFMNAILPDQARAVLKDRPDIDNAFLSDPDHIKEANEFWDYVADYGFATEECASKFIYNQMTRLRS